MSWSAIPERWFCPEALGPQEAQLLLQERARVAQKCTGRAKKPVFLLPEKVVKGPWTPQDLPRILRELGRIALCDHWSHPEAWSQVLLPRLFLHPENHCVYLVTEALYRAPASMDEWPIASCSRSASAVGPRWLEVVDRETTGVLRVSDWLRQEPLSQAPGIWEHLFHRYLLKCGDSGLHNMLVHPESGRPVGLDLDEGKALANEDPEDWVSLLFKRPPARALMPTLEACKEEHRPQITAILEHLCERIQDAQTQALLDLHGLDGSDLLPRLQQLFWLFLSDQARGQLRLALA